MIAGMTRRMNSPYCRPFDLEDLTVDDGFLRRVWGVLVYRIGKVWVEAEKIRYTTGVVTMPMCEQYV